MYEVDEVKKLIDAAEKKREAAEQSYQDSGMIRYYREMCKQEVLVDALSDALKNKKYRDVAHRLSTSIRQWSCKLQNNEFEDPKAKAERINKIIEDIKAEAIYCESEML